MFRSYNQNQMFLLPPSLKDFVDEGHPAHVINDLVDKLELSVLEKRYGNMGQPAHEPRMMLKVILYGYSVGLFSSRKWMQACQENLAFKFLAGMEQPSYRTFIEFFQRHRDDLPAVFYETVKLARALGLVRFANIALDGTKIKANTSKHKAMSYGRMKEEEKKLKEEIAALLKKTQETDHEEDGMYGADNDGYHVNNELARREERLKKIEEAKAALEDREKKDHPGEPIDPKKQISFADTEARCFSKKSDGTEYVYNAQASVDMDSQIIVENHIEDSVTDTAAVKPALENMKEGIGENPDHLVADSAYGNVNTVEACRTHEVTPVCATTREDDLLHEKERGSKGLNAFSYDATTNILRCPHDIGFRFDHWTDDGRYAVYKNLGDGICTCGGVALTGGGQTLRVRRSHLAQRELQHLMGIHRDLYRRRKCTVEPVFGQIKRGIGFRQFLRRGLRNAGGEWHMVCTAFNLKKIGTLLRVKRLNGLTATLTSAFTRGNAHCDHLFKLLTNLINVQVSPLGHCV
jgi:transposase